MNKQIIDNLIAFSIGDLFATVSLLNMQAGWLHTAETLGIKLAVIVGSGFVGGAAGLLGKHLMQKYVIDRFFSLLIISCVAATTGCTPKVAGLTHHNATTSKDSTTVLIQERYVPVFLPGDTVVINTTVDCGKEKNTNTTTSKKTANPKPLKVVVAGKRSSGTVEVDSAGKLTAILNCHQWIDSVKVRDNEIARLKSTHKTDSIVVTKQVRYVPKIYQASMWFSWIVIVLLALWAGYKAAKVYLKWQLPF